jgi:selenocysteine-specific elongation factor
MPLLLGLPPAECREHTRLNPHITAVGAQLVSAATATSLKQSAVAQVKEFHARHPAAAGLSLETLRRTLRGPPAVVTGVLDSQLHAGELVLREGLVLLPGFTPRLAGSTELVSRVLAALDKAGLEAPTVEELERRLEQSELLAVLRRLASEGSVKAVESDRFFSTKVLDQFVSAIRELGRTEPVTPARIRERLGLSRKYIIPLLEWADRSGVTKRVGDTRVLS